MRAYIKKREQQKQYIQELDDDLLQIADNQTEREHEAFMKEKIDRQVHFFRIIKYRTLFPYKPDPMPNLLGIL